MSVAAFPDGGAARRLQHFFSVFHAERYDRWLVLRADAARDLLRSGSLRKREAREATAARFTGPALGLFHEHNVLFNDPPKHSRLRRVMRQLYPAHDVASLDPMIAGLTSELLDELDPGGDVELFSALALPLPVRVICTLIGIPSEELPVFMRWSVVATEIAEPDAHGPGIDGAEETAEAAVDLVRGHLRRGTTRSDAFFGVLRAAIAEGTLSEDEACSMVLMSFSAGHETTASLIGACVTALGDDPDLQDAVRRDAAARAAFVQEVVRLASPIQYVEYAVARRQEVATTTLEEGDRVAVLFGVANRDGGVFTDPDRLDLVRDEPTHLAFGAGRHACPGGALATREAEVAIGALLQRWDVVVDPEQVRWAGREFIRGPDHLPCTLTPRHDR